MTMKINNKDISAGVAALIAAAVGFCGLCVAAWMFAGRGIEYGITGGAGLAALAAVLKATRLGGFIDRNTPDTP